MRWALVPGLVVGAGLAGFLLGGLRGPEAVVRAPPSSPPRSLFEELPPWEEPGEEQLAAVEAATAVLAKDVDLPPPGELFEALKRTTDEEKSQILLIGMVANAARKGPAALPEIREMLASGVDLKLPWEGEGLGYPSLRVALLAAAEATGDPAATQLIAEVTRTAESPVEVVFGAHMLDRLAALDPATAQRALESLGKPLPKEQVKALEAIAGKVVPAAAAADPVFAENFLQAQLRLPKGTGADPRFVAPVLDGLPTGRARELVMANLAAADVSGDAKRSLAKRAAQRAELPMLQDLKHGIEAGIFPPDVAATVAHSAVANRAYGRIERDARRALKDGDLTKARSLATDYYQWLNETEQTVEAARRMGAQLRKDLPTYVKLQRQRLDSLRQQIENTAKKLAAPPK